MVIAPASTGRLSSSSTAVTMIAQVKSGTRSRVIPGARMDHSVTMKLIAPSVDEIPARWRAKIARSTEAPEWDPSAERGGYTVHPVPAPCSTTALRRSSTMLLGRSQNEMLFSRGKAMSTAPICTGSM